MKVDWTGDKELRVEREEILRKAKEIINSWGLRMPEAVSIVLDFGLGDFYRFGLVEFWIANEEKEGYCGKFLFLFPNQSCPAHHHKIKHETFFVLKGRLGIRVDEGEKLLNEGEIVPMPQGTVHSFWALDGPALVLEVSKPCLPKDSIFEDEIIGEL